MPLKHRDSLRISPFGGVQTPIFSRRAFGAPDRGRSGVRWLNAFKNEDFLRNSPYGGVPILIFSRRAFGAPEVMMVCKNAWA